MNAGGWPDAADEWTGNTISYGGGGSGRVDPSHGQVYADHGPVYPDRGPVYTDHAAMYRDHGPVHYDEAPYGEAAHDTMPRGVSAHEPFEYGVRFRAAEPGFAAPEAGLDPEEAYSASWEFEEGLARLLRTAEPEPPAAVVPRQRYAHRRRPRRVVRALSGLRRLAGGGPVPSLKLISLLIACVTAVIVAVVGALSGVVSYGPLRRLALPGGFGDLAAWWPLLVYGPWLVAALSILRSAVHRRRAVHSWVVVVCFSAVAVYLCVAHSGHTPVGLAVSGLPPIAALICFQQLVRQITLTSPPLNSHSRPRHTVRGG